MVGRLLLKSRYPAIDAIIKVNGKMFTLASMLALQLYTCCVFSLVTGRLKRALKNNARKNGANVRNGAIYEFHYRPESWPLAPAMLTLTRL